MGGCRNGTIIGHHPGTGNDFKQDCGYYTQEQVKDGGTVCRWPVHHHHPRDWNAGPCISCHRGLSAVELFPLTRQTTIYPRHILERQRKGKEVQQTWGVFPMCFAPTDYTFNFCRMLDEVMTLFPLKYIHVRVMNAPKTTGKSPSASSWSKTKTWKMSTACRVILLAAWNNTSTVKFIGWDEMPKAG